MRSLRNRHSRNPWRSAWVRCSELSRSAAVGSGGSTAVVNAVMPPPITTATRSERVRRPPTGGLPHVDAVFRLALFGHDQPQRAAWAVRDARATQDARGVSYRQARTRVLARVHAHRAVVHAQPALHAPASCRDDEAARQRRRRSSSRGSRAPLPVPRPMSLPVTEQHTDQDRRRVVYFLLHARVDLELARE